MLKADLRRQVLKLPKQERLELAQYIWTTIEDSDGSPLPDWQKEILAERLKASETEEPIPWETARASIWPTEK